LSISWKVACFFIAGASVSQWVSGKGVIPDLYIVFRTSPMVDTASFAAMFFADHGSH